jgi:hypothetical protein
MLRLLDELRRQVEHGQVIDLFIATKAPDGTTRPYWPIERGQACTTSSCRRAQSR